METESFSIDYLRFNLKSYLRDSEINNLAVYFRRLGFSSYIKERDTIQKRTSIFDDADLTKEFQSLKEKMEILQDQVNSLQQRVIHLENQRNINMLSAADRMPKKAYSKTEEGNYYHLTKIRPKIGQISSLWKRFQNRRESKLFKKDFNFKLKEQSP